MRPRMQSATLLSVILISLLLQPVLGFPFGRQALVKSARGDDLLSGSDFLSVFIGASIPRSRSYNRNRAYNKVNKHIEDISSEEPITRASYNEETSRTSEISNSDQSSDRSSFVTESFDDSPSSFKEAAIVHLEENDGTTLSSTTLADDIDIDVLNNGESHNSPAPNTVINGVSSRYRDIEPIGESSIATSKRIEFIPYNSASSSNGYVQDVETEDSFITTTTIPFNEKGIGTTTNLDDVSFEVENQFSTFLNKSNEESLKLTETSDSATNDALIGLEKNPNHRKIDFNFERSQDISLSPYAIQNDDTERTENETQVISVRVSSSVALAPVQQSNKIDNDSKNVITTYIDSFSNSVRKTDTNHPIPESASLVTEEQPAATAIQRSQFSVEEASPSSSVLSVHQESSSSKINFPSKIFPPPDAIESPTDPQSSPVSYHTSVSTATSGSRVQFYSEPPSYHREPSSVAESVQRSIITQHQPQEQSFGQIRGFQKSTANIQNSEVNYDPNKQMQDYNPSRFQTNFNPGNVQLNSHQHSKTNAEQGTFNTDSREQKSFITHQERNYELPEEIYVTPERTYSSPEQNYEVDESVSVMSNGKAHGVQYPAATSGGQEQDAAARDFNSQEEKSRDPNSKFGYVVEGRNFRKYQVEERTSDGFIVGEYGVVRHDDGSLRGVRYTADGTINPRLIYDALVKFLSL